VVESTATGPNTITLQDCIGLCGLSEEEVLAIAEHEHLPEIAATALAQYLLSQEERTKFGTSLSMMCDEPNSVATSSMC
jgi:hypothetical protein